MINRQLALLATMVVSVLFIDQALPHSLQAPLVSEVTRERGPVERLQSPATLPVDRPLEPRIEGIRISKPLNFIHGLGLMRVAAGGWHVDAAQAIKTPTADGSTNPQIVGCFALREQVLARVDCKIALGADDSTQTIYYVQLRQRP